MIKKRKYIKNNDGTIKLIVYTIEYENRNYKIHYSGSELIHLSLEQQGMDPLAAYRYGTSIKRTFLIEKDANNSSVEIIKKVKNILGKG